MENDSRKRSAQRVLLLMATKNNAYLNYHRDCFEQRFDGFYCLVLADTLRESGVKRTQSRIMEIIEREGINLVIVMPFALNFEISVEFYASLKSRAHLVFWFFDDETYFDAHSKYYAQAADAVVTTDLLAVSAYQKLGMTAISYFSSYSKDDYFPSNVKKDIDVSFVGNVAKQDRRAFLEFLSKEGIRVESYGNETPNGPISMDRMREVFSRSKINLNFTKIDPWTSVCGDDPLLARARSNKGRPIEIALTRSFCLSEYTPTLNQLFVIGREIDVFHSRNDLLEKVRHYLAHPDAGEKIAASAYQRAIAEYESETYFSAIFNQIDSMINRSGHERNNVPILLSRAFETKAVRGLTILFFVQVRHGRFLPAFDVMLEALKYRPLAVIQGMYLGTIRMFLDILHRVNPWG